jgi:signal transduction histidine kinase
MTKIKKSKPMMKNEKMPQIESYIELRENYIKALEQTIKVLRHENKQFNENNLAIRHSIDELVAMQQLSNVISVTTEPQNVIDKLVELTKQVIPVHDANIYLFNQHSNHLEPLVDRSAGRLDKEAQQQLESGIIDWVFSEKRTIVIPDLEYMVSGEAARNFVIVPLIIRNKPIGIFIIQTEKPREEFSSQDIQLLSVLANQAAVGIANWQSNQQLKQVNDELKASQGQMIQTAKLAAIGELAAGILHEIKNPLQIIMMHLDMVRRGRAMENWNDLVLQQVRRLNDITKRLMRFSTNASEDLPIAGVDINKAIEEMLALVEHDFSRENVLLETNLDVSSPVGAANLNFLQQVFLNILLNARDAMPERGTITVESFIENERVAISFTDTGVGIPKEHLTDIFKPFFTTKEREHGTGLGLSISNKIITQFGGKIVVQSEVGKGSTFTIYLPIWSQHQ